MNNTKTHRYRADKEGNIEEGNWEIGKKWSIAW